LQSGQGWATIGKEAIRYFGERSVRIEHYSFGKIVIDGKTYTSDVVLYPEMVDASWWRSEGHCLRVEDLRQVLEARPKVLIIGTGYSGLMVVPEETMRAVRSRGIDLRIQKTKEAVEAYNNEKEKAVIAALHLTC